MKWLFSSNSLFLFYGKKLDRVLIVSIERWGMVLAWGVGTGNSTWSGGKVYFPWLGIILFIGLIWFCFVFKPLLSEQVGMVSFQKPSAKSSGKLTTPRVRLQEGLEQDRGMKERIETLSVVLSKKVKAINGLVTRNGGRGLISLLLKAVRGVRPKATKSVVRQVAKFTFASFQIAQHSGLKGLVIYLKASQVLLQQCVAGYRVVDLADLKVRPKRNRAGLPTRMIPASVRRAIVRDRDVAAIKLWMTLFGLFRILEFRGKLSFATIVEAGQIKLGTRRKWKSFLEEEFVPGLTARAGAPSIPKPGLFPILKSSPTTSDTPYVNTSFWSLVRSARLWCSSKDLWRQLNVASQALGLSHLPNRIRLVALASHPVLDLPVWAMANKLYPHGGGYLGKLGFKLEPAGKVRVFAMVDAWTQWLFAPLHGAIFNSLKKLRTDGTFDQMRPIERLQQSLDRDRRTFASIDLSAATDRLPISLQVTLLEVWLRGVVPNSKEFAAAWRDLLVRRHYQTGVGTGRKTRLHFTVDMPKTEPREVLYAVGQPMGALSSWAMLALTHHAIVQWAASRVGVKHWFEDYAILGDDIVIANGKVASEYRLILSEIGVTAGLAKSVMARGRFVVEFAKKFFVDDTRADMLPLKEVIATWVSSSLVLEFTRKYKLSLNSILALLGFGYKARSYAVNKSLWDLSNRLRVYVVWLCHPSSPLGKGSYVDWLCMRTVREGMSPSDEVLEEVLEMSRAMIGARENEIFTAAAKYEASAEESCKVGNSHFPMSFVPENFESMSDRSFERVHVSWSNVLGSDIEIDLDEDPRYQKGVVAWGPRSSSPVGIEMDIGLPFEIFQVIGKWRADGATVPTPEPDAVPETGESDDLDFLGIPKRRKGFRMRIQDPATRARWGLFTPPVRERLETSLRHLFSDDPLSTLIPKEFWPESRQNEKRFRDFLEIFKVWTELSRPIWAEFYKSRPDLAAFGKQKADKQVSKPVTSLVDYVERPLALMKFRVGPWWIYQGLYASVVRIGTSTFNFMGNYAPAPIWWLKVKDAVWTAFWILVIILGLLASLDTGESVGSVEEVKDFVEVECARPAIQETVPSNWDRTLVWILGVALVATWVYLLFPTGGGGEIPPLSQDNGLIPLVLPELVGVVPHPDLIRLGVDTVSNSSEDLVSPIMAHGYWE